MKGPSIAVGEKFENFSYDTAWEQGKHLFDLLEIGKTLLVFSRYLGCHPCLMELINLAGTYPKIRAKGGNLLVVMQSDPAVVREVLEPGVTYKIDGALSVFGKEQMPYDLVCDPDMMLYKQYGIPAAKNKLGLVSPSALAKSKRAQDMGLEHGKYEGDELQLPATFLLEQDGTVAMAHYGKSFADYLSEEEILELF